MKRVSSKINTTGSGRANTNTSAKVRRNCNSRNSLFNNNGSIGGSRNKKSDESNSKKCIVCKSSNTKQLNDGWWCKNCKKSFTGQSRRRVAKKKTISLLEKFQQQKSPKISPQISPKMSPKISPQILPQLQQNKNNINTNNNLNDNITNLNQTNQPPQQPQQPQHSFSSLLQLSSFIPFSPDQLQYYPRESPTFDPLFHPFPLEVDSYVYQEFSIGLDSMPCSNY